MLKVASSQTIFFIKIETKFLSSFKS